MKKSVLAALALCAAMNIQAGDARYIFYFIGDGMGLGHVNAAEAYNRDARGNDKPLLMLTFPVASQARTYSASSPITDSAAAGTALASGHKTRNGMVGMNPDTVPVNSIAVELMEAGYAVGVGTTVQADDATPAAWYAHAANRGMKKLIAPQAAQSGLTFLAGGDFKLRDAGEGEFADFVGLMRKEGYTVAAGFEAFEKTNADKPGKVLLYPATPSGGQVGYTIDSIPGCLTCAQITEACLRTLENSGKDKFMMMIEGGNIDWAAHANDAGAVIKEIVNFQDAIEVAYRFYLEHPEETLIVITADHDTGGMSLGRNGSSDYNLAYADAQRASKTAFGDWTRRWASRVSDPQWEEMEAVLKEKLGFWDIVPVTEAQTEELKKLFVDTFVTRDAKDEQTLYATFDAFTAKVFDILSYHMGIGWTTTYHAGNFVPVYAIGAGSSHFTGNLDNTEIPRLILRAADLD